MMEAESLSDADRIADNAVVLGTVESEIVSLEQMFVELESLEKEKDRLGTAVQSLHTEEAQILQDGASESVIVKKLLETRGRRDVQSARLTNIQDKIAAHTADLTIQGERVRKAFKGVLSQLWTACQQRVTTTLTELFGGPFIRLRTGRVEVRELVDQTQLMKQLKDVRNRVAEPVGDKEQELGVLQQQSRTWLIEVADLVHAEPGLLLKSIPAKQQPIEQPAREMVAA